METIEIAIEKEAFESTLLHVVSKIMPDLLGELLLAIPATVARFLGGTVGSRMNRQDGNFSDVLVPLSAEVAAFLRSFAEDGAENLGRSILVSDLRVRGIHAEPWGRHLALLRESIDRLLPSWPEWVLPLTFQRNSTVPGTTFEESLIDRLFVTPRRRFPSPPSVRGGESRETASTVDVPVFSAENECRIRVAVDVFLSASREATDIAGHQPMSVVQRVFFDFRAHARVETADSDLLAETEYFRTEDGRLVRASRTRRAGNSRSLGVPALLPFSSLALTLDRVVIDSDKPLAFRDSSLRQDHRYGRTIVVPNDLLSADLFGYLCFGRRPSPPASVLPEFDGIIAIVQKEITELLQRDLNDILCELYDELLDLGSPLHGVNLSPHYPRDDERASRPFNHSDPSNDCRFLLDERWFIWYFGVAVTPSQVRINIQLAQPSAFGWRPRQFCGLPTETLADCYPRVRVSNDIQDPLQVSIERWTRFFSNPGELPLSRRVTVRAAYPFMASLLSRLIDEVLDYGLSAAGSALRVLERKKVVEPVRLYNRERQQVTAGEYWRGVRESARHWLEFRVDGGTGPFYSAYAVEQYFSFAIPSSRVTIRQFARPGGRASELLGSPWSDVEFVYGWYIAYEQALSRGERVPPDWPINEVGRWMLRSLEALSRGEVPPPTEEEQAENAGRLEYFYRILECGWLADDITSSVDAVLRDPTLRSRYPSEVSLRAAISLDRQERFVNICRIAALDLAPTDEFSVASARRLLRESVVPTMHGLRYVLRSFEGVWRFYADRFWNPSGLGDFRGSPFPLAILSFLEVNHTVARGGYPGHTRGSFSPDAFLQQDWFTWAEPMADPAPLSPLCQFRVRLRGDVDVVLPVDAGDFDGDVGLTFAFRTQYAGAEVRREGQFYPELVDPTTGDPSSHPLRPDRVPGLVGVHPELSANLLLRLIGIGGESLSVLRAFLPGLLESITWLFGLRGNLGAAVWQSILGGFISTDGVFVGGPTTGDDRTSSELARSSVELTVTRVADRLVEVLDNLLGEPLRSWLSPEYRYIPRDLQFLARTSPLGVVLGFDLTPPAIIRFFYGQRIRRQNRLELRLPSVTERFPRGVLLSFLGGSGCDLIGEPYAVIEVEVRNPDPVLSARLYGVTLELKSGLEPQVGAWLEEPISGSSIYQWQPGRSVPDTLSRVVPLGRSAFRILVPLRTIWSEFLRINGVSIARSFGLEPLVPESSLSPLPPQLSEGLPNVRVSQMGQFRSASALRLSLRSSFGVEQIVLNDPVIPMLNHLRELSTPEAIARARDLCRSVQGVPRPDDVRSRPDLADLLRGDRWGADAIGVIPSGFSNATGGRLLEQYIAEELESRYLQGEPTPMTVSPVLGSLNREGSTPFDFRSTSVEWMAPRDAGVFIAGIGDVVDSADVHERDVFSAVLTATLGTKKPT